MAEDYAYACQRAELLGLPRPSEAEWNETRRATVTEPTEEELEDSIAEDLDSKDGSLSRAGGGLDELNSILSATQKKLNRFKTVCGGLGAMLKVRVGSRASTPDHAHLRPNPADVDNRCEPTAAGTDDDETIEVEYPVERVNGNGGRNGIGAASRKQDIDEKVQSHVDKLDILIAKAENAQYSMQHQSKQMRRYLK